MFTRLLLMTIALGAILGFMLPSGPQPTPAPVNKPSPVRADAPSPAPIDTLSSAGTADPIVLNRGPDSHFYVNARVNGQPVRFLIDTGSSRVALTSADARNIGLPFSPDEFTVIGSGASGDVRGKPITLSTVAIGPKEVYHIPGVIVDQGLKVSLLGQSFLSRIASVEISQDHMTIR